MRWVVKTVMLFFVRNCLMIVAIWEGALLCGKNQLLD